MSRLLESAARLDKARAAAMDANDAAMNVRPRELGLYVVRIKSGDAVRVSFPVYGYDSCSVVMQHMDLLQAGEKLDVQAGEQS
jgi:hypothetical protein